jgi:glutamate--cysteine ligase
VVPVDPTGAPCPIEPDHDHPDRPASGPWLRCVAAETGWRSATSPAGAPAFELPGGGALSFEPGGQMEYSSPPCPDSDRLVAHMEEVLEPLARSAAGRGIRLLARGLDPLTPVHDAPLRVRAERYLRMAAHYDRRGTAGRRMMRQTAALHLNLDLGGEPHLRWRVANALAPLLTALFANSPEAEGSPTGHRSTRALQWRHLDPTRTGVRPHVSDPVGDYVRFALDADAFLLGHQDQPARPFRDWLERGAGGDDWERHLSTLFPEVRPRGYLELRCLDALPLALYGAPVAVAAGVLYDAESLAAAEACLPPADPALLERAGRLGMADPEVASAARLALDLAEAGLRRGRVAGVARVAEVLQDFRRRFSDPGLDPGHDPASDLIAP